MKLNCPLCSKMLSTIPDICRVTIFVTRMCRRCKSRWSIGLPPDAQSLTHIIRIEPFPGQHVGLQTPERV